jgi:adenosylmethionine-8-amino-7-oxononanoate aminotransferase
MNYSKRDAEVIWHPYTTHFNHTEFPVIKSSLGSSLILDNGEEILDAISSWWVNLHGHSHPLILQKITEAMKDMQQVMFAGFTHSYAIELSEKILSLFNNELTKVFFSDNGSTSVEVALKMCFQYWTNQGQSRNKIIALRGSYHGDTFGTMSVSERGVFSKPFWPFLFEVEFIESPVRDGVIDPLKELQKLYAKYPDEIAGIIYEPMVQGAGGMIMHDPFKLMSIIQFVRSQEGIIIADEVMTGFGRTGRLFGSHYLNITPDLVCLSKGLTGGILPLGLTLACAKIFQAFESPEKSKSLLHGHSFTGNVLSCAAALASLEILLKEDCQEKIKEISKQHEEFANVLKSFKGPQRNVRVLGTILAMEIAEKTGYFSEIRDKVYRHFLNDGILLRPLGNTLYILPPYCFDQEDMSRTYDSILRLLKGNDL